MWKHFPLALLYNRWLKRKRTEKRAEQQAARERSRRLVLEERRARRMHDLHCTINEIKPLQFSDPYGYRYWSPHNIHTWLLLPPGSELKVLQFSNHCGYCFKRHLLICSYGYCSIELLKVLLTHLLDAVDETNGSSLLLIFHSSFFNIQRSNRCSSGYPCSNSFRHLK